MASFRWGLRLVGLVGLGLGLGLVGVSGVGGVGVGGARMRVGARMRGVVWVVDDILDEIENQLLYLLVFCIYHS